MTNASVFFNILSQQLIENDINFAFLALNDEKNITFINVNNETIFVRYTKKNEIFINDQKQENMHDFLTNLYKQL